MRPGCQVPVSPWRPAGRCAGLSDFVTGDFGDPQLEPQGAGPELMTARFIRAAALGVGFCWLWRELLASDEWVPGLQCP